MLINGSLADIDLPATIFNGKNVNGSIWVDNPDLINLDSSGETNTNMTSD